MVWACFSYFEKSDLFFLSEQVDAKKHTDTPETNFFPFSSLNHGESWIFNNRMLQFILHLR